MIRGMSDETQHVNGTAPVVDTAGDDGAAPEVATAGEKIMGAFAILVAVGISLAAIDLISGGKAWAQFRPAPASDGN